MEGKLDEKSNPLTVHLGENGNMQSRVVLRLNLRLAENTVSQCVLSRGILLVKSLSQRFWRINDSDLTAAARIAERLAAEQRSFVA